MRCKFSKSNGESCKNQSLKNEKYCYWHSKSIPEKVKQENRSNGGKQKAIKVTGEIPEIELNSIGDILKLNSLMVNKVLKNEIDVRLCTGIGYLLNLQIKCIELNSIEKKIDEMENLVVHVKLPKELQGG